jgi:hypothetical protein
MSDEELVRRFIVAGRDIFAETDLAAEIQMDIIARIAMIVGKTLGHHEARRRAARTSAKVTSPVRRGAPAGNSPDHMGGDGADGKRPGPLAAMTLKERRTFLALHYQDRTPWADVRPRKPQEPTREDFERWADGNFPDRRELGLVLSDLSVLDKEAYGKLRHWANRRGGASKIDPAEFGFPSKVVHYDPLKPVPSGAELFKAIERGDPKAAELRRDYMRARYHQQRDI